MVGSARNVLPEAPRGRIQTNLRALSSSRGAIIRPQLMKTR